MTDRILARLRVFTGYGDDLSHLLSWSPAPLTSSPRLVESTAYPNHLGFLLRKAQLHCEGAASCATHCITATT